MSSSCLSIFASSIRLCPKSYPSPIEYGDADGVRKVYAFTSEFLLTYDLSVEGGKLICRSDRGEVRLMVIIDGEKISVEGMIGNSFASTKLEVFGFGTTEVALPEKV